ncbi:hypothetical protein VE03_06464 [Pseudogymnoascus sp. 23342-1-I1]|nr:hypothetical protein VE03_06464 [Pseudogymnoascus sp. 23342-1-I1]
MSDEVKAPTAAAAANAGSVTDLEKRRDKLAEAARGDSTSEVTVAARQQQDSGAPSY